MGIRIGKDEGRKMELLGRAYSFVKFAGNMTWALRPASAQRTYITDLRFIPHASLSPLAFEKKKETHFVKEISRAVHSVG